MEEEPAKEDAKTMNGESIGVLGWAGVSVSLVVVAVIGTRACRKAGATPRWLVSFWLACLYGAMLGVAHVMRVYDALWAERVHEAGILLLIAALIAQPDADATSILSPWAPGGHRWLCVVFVGLGLCYALVLPALAIRDGKALPAWDFGMVAGEVILGFGLAFRYLPAALGQRPMHAP